jgi:hypothetical protein
MKLSFLAFDLSQFPMGSERGLVGTGLAINSRSGDYHSGRKAVPYPLGRRRPLGRPTADNVIVEFQRIIDLWAIGRNIAAENETRLQKQARPVLRFWIKATPIWRGRDERCDRI